MNKTILVIDDDKNLVESLSELLEYEGYKTLIATNVIDGLNHLRAESPDAIICDWQMPGLNGKEILREIRLTKETEDIPFIMITGHKHLETDFEPTVILHKPLSILTLRQTLNNIMSDATDVS